MRSSKRIDNTLVDHAKHIRTSIYVLAATCLALLGVSTTVVAQETGTEGSGQATETSNQMPGGTPSAAEVRMPGPGEHLSDLPPPPWANTADVPAPAFLDTTDRRIADDRPPPSPEQVAALREMEAEVARFSGVARAYRNSVNSILRREYVRRRRERQAGYARQILVEEELQNQARDRAIRLFEAFVRRYPDDANYTPDAMFRLGELYYERAAIQYQEAADADDGGELPHADFAPTIELYRRLIQAFPGYRRIDGAYYLIGYCFNEMGQMEEARLAWLNLVCANRFEYTGQLPVTPEQTASDEAATEGEEHPALTLDEEAPAPAGIYEDPYEGCTPVAGNTRFVSEVWLRIGEYHFDFDFEPHGLDRAISAYDKVLQDPENRNFNLALYKVAWAYYRASRYPEAIEHFSRLIDWSDEQLARTGRAGSELRAEAVQYLGIAFAYDDWNENQIPDEDEGGQTGIQRIQDQNVLPQERPWTSEIYFELGQVYFEEAKYPDAIAVWELALSRWPNHRRAPEVVANIARAHQRHQEFEEAVGAQGRLAEYREGSDWWNENMTNPVEQRQAEELAEGALISEATRHHQLAQRMRRDALENRSIERLDQALAEYNLAATAYRAYLENYPNSPNSYELQYNLADALYWSEQYEEAARVYAGVRDSNLDDRYLSESARRVVESLRRLVQAATESGELEVRDAAPEPSGTPARVQSIEMPLMVQRLAQAREVYLARVPEHMDREHVRAAYDYNNALLLYFYGYWPQARARFLEIYEGRCSGSDANETGEVAWGSLNNMAVALDDRVEAERLARDVAQRECTFRPDGELDVSDRDAFCEDSANSEHPICQAGNVLTNVRYLRAVELFERAEAASGDEQRRLFEEAATLLVTAVNDEPDHPQAPVALLKAAQALERTQRYESAGRLYQRVVDDVGPMHDDSPERQQELDSILGTAYFRLAYTANRFFDYDRAVESYRAIADSARFARSSDPEMPARITDSLINAARILEYQQQYRRAAQYFGRAADAISDAGEQRSARYRVAEMAFKQGDWNRSIREMRAFISRYGGDRSGAELVVQAFWRIAQAREEMHQQRDYRSALQDVVSAYQRLGGAAGSMAAEYAANSRFLIVDPALTQLEGLSIAPGRQPNVPTFVSTLNGQIQTGSRRTQTVAEGYEPILAYRRPTWTISALARQGRAYEVLARSVLDATIVMPTDLSRRIRGASEDVRDEVQVQFDDQVRQVLDGQVRPIECFAVVRYALAARAAVHGSIDNENTRLVIDRLQAYGDERIAECIATHQAQDQSFGAYRPGEFTRARRGQHMQVPDGVSPMPLAREEE